METININKDTFDELENNHIFHGGGAEGRIYFNPNNKDELIKIYRKYIPFINKNEIILDEHHKERFVYLNSLQNEFKELVLPKGYVLYKDIAVGPIIDKIIPSKNLLVFLLQNPNLFYEVFTSLNDLLEKTHQKNIYLVDIASDNVLINQNGDIRIIDCDSNGLVIKKEKSEELKQIAYDNYKIYLKDFFHYWTGRISLDMRMQIDDTPNEYEEITKLVINLEKVRKRN